MIKDFKGEGRIKEAGSRYLSELTKRQKNRCIYCAMEFGDYFTRDGRVRMVTPRLEYVVPWYYAGNAEEKNTVVACGDCDRIKGGRIFNGIGEARIYVRDERSKRNYPLQELPKGVPAFEGMAPLLQPQMSNELLLELKNCYAQRRRETRRRSGIERDCEEEFL